jgi:alpha-1,6-mannosyltransferase
VVFLDVNTFFAPKAGGIRTYHHAKIAWFKAHPEHAYHLAYPAASRAEKGDGPVHLHEGWGPALTADPAGYRLLLDLPAFLRVLRSARPAVLEAGDPWLSGIACLLLRKLGIFKGLLVSFYHSDPIPSYLEPWAARGAMRPLKRALVRLLAKVFYRLQRGYDLTAVSSRAMEASLRSRGVAKVAHLPFGVPAPFLEPLARSAAAGPVRFLYCGRLDREKGVDLLLEILPALLEVGNIEVTVVGRGSYAPRFQAFIHPRYRFLGYLEGPAAVREAYDAHQVFLAPGSFETFGLGVLEAMARGMAVVGPDRGGTAELLQEAASPYLFPAEDAAAFLRAARAAAVAGPEALLDQGRRARGVAERYGTWDKAFSRMVERYAVEAGP